jgi:hypothetical protein
MKNLANFFLLKVIKNSWIYMKIIPQNLQIVFWLEKWQNFANEITLIVSRFKDMVHSSWPSGGWVLRGHIGISLSLRLEILKRMIPTPCKATHDNYLKRTQMMKKVLNILFPIPTTTKENLKAKQSTQKNSPKNCLFSKYSMSYKVSLKFSQILSTFN